VVGVRQAHERLGRAVPLEDRQTAGRRDGAVQGGGKRSRAGDGQPKAGELGGTTRHLQAVVHRRHAEEQRAAESSAGAEDLVDAEMRQEHGGGAGVQRPEQPDAEAMGVEHREGVHEAVRRRPAPGRTQRLGIGQQAGVGVGSALRLAGRARGEEDEGDIEGLRRVEPVTGHLRWEGGGAVPGGGAGLDDLHGGVDLLHAAPKGRIFGHAGCRPHLGDDVAKLGSRQRRVHRHEDEAGSEDGDDGDGGSERPSRAKENAVAGREAAGDELSGQPTARGLQLPAGHHAAALALDKGGRLRIGRPSPHPAGRQRAGGRRHRVRCRWRQRAPTGATTPLRAPCGGCPRSRRSAPARR